MSRMATLDRPGARPAAFRVLHDVESTGALDETAMDALLRSLPDPRDRALTLELVYGILRLRGSLDWRLNAVSHRPVERLPLPIAIILRLGAYQLLHLTRIPPSAAVHEAVVLAKTIRGYNWSGYVNAVLRTLLREPPPRMPDPTQDVVAAFSVRYACPPWLVKRWIAHKGAAAAERVCAASIAVPPLTVRVNTVRATRPRLQEAFGVAGVRSQPTEVSPVGLRLEKQGTIPDLPFFAEGWFYVEDEAAQLVAPVVDPQPGERILDACAAPGGKTTHLAALMHNQGAVVAVDRHRPRLRLVEDNCRRLGLSIVKTCILDLTRMTAPPEREPFDRILVDAPCSGLGVLRRHPEGKWHKHEEQLLSHHLKQVAILSSVAHLLRPGGVIVYSTCSTEPEENEQVIEHFLNDHRTFAREPVTPWLPTAGKGLVNARGDLSTMPSLHSMDGFYAARLRKDS